MDVHATNFKSKIDLNHLSNIDELNDLSAKRKAEIFKRAAEISPNVFECTIGPKVDLYSSKPVQNVENKVEKENNQNLSPPQITPKNENTKLQSSPLFDFDMIKTALALKSSEKERKEKLRKEIEEHRLELEIKIKQNMIRQREPNNIQSNSLMDLRNLNDQKIFEEAERYANQEQEKNLNELKKINHEKNRKLRELSLKAIPTGKFSHNYEKLVQLLISQDKNSISDEYNKQLKELVASFEALIHKLKSLQIGPAEVLMAESLCDKVVALQNKLKDDLKAKQAEQKNIELQKRLAEQQRAKEQQLQQQQQQQNLQQQILLQQQEQNRKAQEIIQPKPLVDTVDNTNTSKSYGSKESFQLYQNIMKYFAEVSQRVKSFELDENTKKFRIACKRVLNIQVTTISASSSQHLRDKFEKIFNFISGQNVKQTNADVNINDHELGKDYSLLLLVRLLVMQAKAEISSNVQVAFPIASIIISIWNILPDFGKIFLGQIFFESPFLVPYFYQNQKGISDVEYLITLGYKVDENGAIEDNDSYFKRQTGIMRLYFAIMVSSGCRSQRQKHPYSIENGWKFLCNIISLNPLNDICATVIFEFLQLTGNEMYARYGKQFHKLLSYVQQCYMPQLSQIDGRRPRKERLELFLQQILQKGCVDKPKGILDGEFW